MMAVIAIIALVFFMGGLIVGVVATEHYYADLVRFERERRARRRGLARATGCGFLSVNEAREMERR